MGEKTCKVPTPAEMVCHMLDKIGYVHNLYGKKVLENSCGEGNFLCEMVRRYILDARRQAITDDKIREGLERDIHGIEKEESIAKACRVNLDEAAREFGIIGVCWSIQSGNALKQDLRAEYQYVVGNPPYITYYNLEQEERSYIRQKFQTCKEGKADYYYAFTEAAIRSLAPDGRMIYLIPNNFFKNHYSEALRKFILPYLTEVEDYTTKKLFGDFLTSSAVILCKKQTKRTTFQYYDVQNNRKVRVKKADLQGKWSFFREEKHMKEPVRLGDCFQISAPVATLLNEAYLLNDTQECDDGDLLVNGTVLEREVIRSAASPKSKQRQENPYIIFPYWYDENGTLMRYEKSVFEQNFPGACAHLRAYQEKLKKRDCDQNSKWFEYGRSQALAHINQPKILLSTLITKRVRYYRLEAETVPYSGMYLVPKKGYTLEQAEEILMSDEFYSYVEEVGINASGDSYRISPRDVCNFVFEKEWYRNAD